MTDDPPLKRWRAGRNFYKLKDVCEKFLEIVYFLHFPISLREL
jgi:hypothetical protein